MRLTNICRRFLKYWDERKQLGAEEVGIFFEGMVDYMDSPDEKKYPSQFISFSEKVNEAWHYKEFENLSKENNFLYGSVWGAIQVNKVRQRRKKEMELQVSLYQRYKEYTWFFKAITASPGIRHCDLAKKNEMSASSLSQLVSRMMKDEIITFNRIGREKYYFLQPRGEAICKKILEDEKKRIRKAKIYQKRNKAYGIVNTETNNMGKGIVYTHTMYENLLYIKKIEENSNQITSKWQDDRVSINININNNTDKVIVGGLKVCNLERAYCKEEIENSNVILQHPLMK